METGSKNNEEPTQTPEQAAAMKKYQEAMKSACTDGSTVSSVPTGTVITYKIFQNPLDQMDAVKQGWSWPGFLFGPFWALFNKRWKIGGIGLVVPWCLNIVLASLKLYPFAILVTIFVGYLFGLIGNELREQNLISRGYEEVGKVEGASTPEGAIAIYVKQRKNPQ